jgi:peptide chain release factor 3
VQGFRPRNASQQVPILAAVGPLQFEVFQYRLGSEYGAESRLDPAEWKFARWIHPATDGALISPGMLPTGAVLADDSRGQSVILFPGDWALSYFAEKNPSIILGELPFDNAPAESRR